MACSFYRMKELFPCLFLASIFACIDFFVFSYLLLSESHSLFLINHSTMASWWRNLLKNSTVQLTSCLWQIDILKEHVPSAMIKARGDQCDSCLALMSPTELIEPRCSICQSKPENRQIEHIYFELPKLEKQVASCFPESEKKWSNCALEIYTGWIKNQLEERCITRGLKWGTKVPESAGVGEKVFLILFNAFFLFNNAKQ